MSVWIVADNAISVIGVFTTREQVRLALSNCGEKECNRAIRTGSFRKTSGNTKYHINITITEIPLNALTPKQVPWLFYEDAKENLDVLLEQLLCAKLIPQERVPGHDCSHAEWLIAGTSAQCRSCGTAISLRPGALTSFAEIQIMYDSLPPINPIRTQRRVQWFMKPKPTLGELVTNNLEAVQTVYHAICDCKTPFPEGALLTHKLPYGSNLDNCITMQQGIIVTLTRDGAPGSKLTPDIALSVLKHQPVDIRFWTSKEYELDPVLITAQILRIYRTCKCSA